MAQGPLSFTRLARGTSHLAGRPATFATMCTLVLAWAVAGPFFGFSDTWQLTINTGTTILTFLMVFLIQATQNRDSDAVQIKLDELIRAVKGARNDMIDLENMEEDELVKVRTRFLDLAERARVALRRGPPEGAEVAHLAKRRRDRSRKRTP